MIILVGGEKGGTGKSTLATNLAVEFARAGGDILIFDTDEQKSMTNWGWLRDEDPSLGQIAMVSKTGEINKEVPKFIGKFDHIIIDAGGQESQEIRSSLMVADIVYSPVRPSSLDLSTLAKMDKLAEFAKTINSNLVCRIILNGCSTNPVVTDADDAEDYINDSDFLHFTTSKVRICERATYKHAVSCGRGVTEMEGKKANEKASEEIRAFFKEVNNG